MRGVITAGVLVTLLLSGCAAVLEPATREAIASTGAKEVFLDDGAIYPVVAAPVRHTIGGTTFTAYAYNGQLPGPILRVRQGSTITVPFTNQLPEPSTIHWHGLRHDIKDDGVPGVSQDPVNPGETHTYTLRFPDAGVFWYHPHVREDRQQDLGLAGTIVVEPAGDPWPNADQEAVLVLDDILIDADGQPVPHGERQADFALMGRFGNVLLINGQKEYRLQAHTGERLRVFLVNAANVRPFNVSFGVPVRVIGSDIGLAQNATIRESVTIHPAERYIIDIVFPEPGTYKIRNVNPWVAYDLGEVVVAPGAGDTSPDASLPPLDLSRFEKRFNDTPDLTLRIDVDVGGMGGMMNMHQMRGMHSVTDIEWEDTMAMMNANSDATSTRWFFEEVGTRLRGMDIHRTYRVGDIVKIRIINDAKGAHPMQHPIHLHGQRFLVTSIDGEAPEQLAWKDTAAIPAGATADLLVDITNPGEWMLHCHIAEHLEAGLMTSITVEPTEGTEGT